MTKTEILTTVKNRIDETDEDTQIDNIIETAFDYCYRRDLGKLDKRISTAYLPIINGVATLPEDLMDIEKITPSLGLTDRKVGNSILTDNTGTFNLIYSYIRTAPGDTEELDMDETLQYLIVLYCCIAYYEYKKRAETTQLYLNKYEMKKRQYIEDMQSYMEEGTQDVYGTTGSDE